MKKAFALLFPALLLAALSCSKKDSNVEIPIPTPTPGTTMMELPAMSQAANPTETPEPLEYVIDDLKGTVLIIESGSTQPEPAEEEETIETGDEIITKSGSQASLTLDENTMFRLSENSDIKVDQLNPNPSNGFISKLQLVEGRILSEVEKLQESHSTFEVSSGGVICGVRGTAFEVQKQGQAVHTSTFHGVVEMKKGGLVQQVGTNQHAAFSLKKAAFLPVRPLKPEEQQRYQNWQKRMPEIRKRQAQRMEAIRAIKALPPDERKQALDHLKSIKPRDRMKAMHQMGKEYSGVNRPAGQKSGSLNRPSSAQKYKGHQHEASALKNSRHNAKKLNPPSRAAAGRNTRPQAHNMKPRKPQPAFKPHPQKHPPQKPAPTHPGAKKKTDDKKRKKK